MLAFVLIVSCVDRILVDEEALRRTVLIFGVRRVFSFVYEKAGFGAFFYSRLSDFFGFYASDLTIASKCPKQH